MTTKTLEKITSNNLISLGLSYHAPKSGLEVNSIQEGIVIDHIAAGKALDICNKLNIENSSVVMGMHVESKRKGYKDFIKIKGKEPDSNLYKIVAIESPGARINTIRYGRVIDKVEAIICENTDCTTRDIEKDIIPEFYVEDKRLYCNYCNTEYTRRTEKVERYINMIEGDRELGRIMDSINNLKDAVILTHTLTLDQFSVKKEKDMDNREKEYIHLIEGLKDNIQLYILDSFFYAGDDKGRMSEEMIRSSVNQRLSNLGFNTKGKYAASRLVSRAVEYGKENFLEKTGDNYMLKQGIDKEKLIRDYMGRQNKKEHLFLFSNMLKAIDEIVEVQK